MNRRCSITWEAQSHPSGGFKAPLELDNGHILAAHTAPLSGGGAEVQCIRSTDGGQNWQKIGQCAASAHPQADIGDGHMIQLRDGTLLYSYRDNNLTPQAADRRYALRVVKSTDRGVHWQHHSTVTECSGTDVGLWSTFLLQKRDGSLQCYYDDEWTPYTQQLPHHQWTSMRSWDPVACIWCNPVVVSRAKNPAHLSRDGMCSVVELDDRHLICAFEGVQTYRPYRGLLRYTTSSDGGRTWSWSSHERSTLYVPRNPDFNVTAPWMIKLTNGTLLCVFTTDEDRPAPGIISTGRLEMSLKCVLSFDNGASWQKTPAIIDDRQPIYFAGVVQLKHHSRKALFVQYDKPGSPSQYKLGQIKA